MSRLNERVRWLEQMRPAQSVLDGMEPEQLAGVLREGILAFERECAEGHGDIPFNRPRDARCPWRCVSEALPALRASLAELEERRGLASH